jgi:putative flippase GtrA
MPTRDPAITAKQRILVLMRSLGAGAFATAADLGTLFLLATVFEVHVRIASPLALIVGFTVQFIGQKYFAFRDDRPNWGKQALAFFVVEALGFVSNLILFDIAARLIPLPYVVTRIMTTNLVYFAICLPLWSRIFVTQPPKIEGRAAILAAEAAR